MGETKHEAPRLREARNHSPGRAVASAGPANPGDAGCPVVDVLPLVRSLPRRRPEALEDKPSKPDRVWNRIPDEVRERIVAMALDVPELSPRELATRFTDTENYFVSESSVYRLLKAHDLITSPAFVVIKAADEFKDKTTAPNQLWQTDFTYLKVIGWGWFYLSTILDDFSRYIIAWKLCTTMRADYVTDKGPAAGTHRIRVCLGPCRAQATVAERQRLQLCLRRPGEVARGCRHAPRPRRALSPADPGEN